MKSEERKKAPLELQHHASLRATNRSLFPFPLSQFPFSMSSILAACSYIFSRKANISQIVGAFLEGGVKGR